jgi:hypothetical protein
MNNIGRRNDTGILLPPDVRVPASDAEPGAARQARDGDDDGFRVM